MELVKRLHFWLGFAGIIIFLLTGQYMFHAYSQLQGMDDGPRMLFRSGHIYFLLTVIINLVIGVYLNPKQLPFGNVVQLVISIIIMLAPVFILTGFFLEPHLNDLVRPYSKPGIFALFGVAMLVIIVSLWKNLKRN